MLDERKARLAQFRARAIEALKANGLRVTSPRLEVIKVLADSQFAMTPYEIHHEVMEAGGHIDVVSVYRILNAFKPIGLVHHIGAVDGYWACSMIHEGVSHSCHVVCRTCRRVVEVKMDDALIASSLKRAEDEGFGPALVQLEIISDSCSKCNGVKPEGR